MRKTIIALILSIIAVAFFCEHSYSAYQSMSGNREVLAMAQVPETSDSEDTSPDTSSPPETEQPKTFQRRGPFKEKPAQIPPRPATIQKRAAPEIIIVPDEEPSAPEEELKKEQAGTQQEIPFPVPSGTSHSPEQIKAFLSKSKTSSKEESYIILNFDNAALKDVINTISSITGMNFLVAPGLDARITIHSSDKIPTTEALNVFESVLELNNMVIVKSGRFYKIVPASTAKQRPIDVQKGSESEEVLPIDRMITQIVQVDFVPAAEIGRVLQPLLSQFGGIIPDPRTNLLIINELSSNLKRVLSILDEIDVNAFESTRMTFFQPEYSDVAENGLNIAQQGVAMIPLERINSLIVFTASPKLLETIEGWLKKLDEEVSVGQNIFVYPVQNVKAEDIAEVLKTIYATEGTTVTTPKTTPKTPTAPRKKGEKPRTPTLKPFTTAAAAPVQTNVEIVVYEPTNSLVILASAGIYRDMKDTILKLDVYPQEVLIEAIIAQVTLSDSDDFGVQWSVLHDVHIEGDDFTGFTSSRSTEAPLIPTNIGTDDAVRSVLASGFSYLFYDPGKIIALVHALSSRGHVNILSAPRLLVKDQEEANIHVGSDIPTATSSTQTTTLDTLTQNIEYRNVGVKLDIKPTINDEKTVVLEIEQEVSSLGEDQQVGQAGNLFPSFNLIETKTSIIVPDKKGIIIGGIIQEDENTSYQGIPVLSNIPVLGSIFRYKSDSVIKKELIIIITPHVVSNRDEADELTKEFIGNLKSLKDYLYKQEIVDVPFEGEPTSPDVYEQ
jgi:general secretion pathway protein D